MPADDAKSGPADALAPAAGAPGPVSPTILPPYRPAPAGLSAAAHAPYEFGPTESLILRNLGSKMSFVGLFMLGSGLFLFISVMVRWVQSQGHDLEVGLLFLTLLFVVVGIWTNRSGREFRSVAETQGKDIPHLMGALENLLKFYTLLYILFFIVLVFAIIQVGAHSLYGILPGRPAAATAPAQPGPG